MAKIWNHPPNWPPAPAGWTPPAGWQPPPDWPPPPYGWQFWTDAPSPSADIPQDPIQNPPVGQAQTSPPVAAAVPPSPSAAPPMSPPLIGQTPADGRPDVSNLWLWLLLLWPLPYAVMFGTLGRLGDTANLLLVTGWMVSVGLVAWKDEQTVKASGYTDRPAPWPWALFLVPVYLVLRQRRIRGSQWPVFAYIGIAFASLIVLGMLAPSDATNSTPTPAPSNSQQGGKKDPLISQGIGSADASGDATLGAVTKSDTATEVVVQVTNNSPEVSDYSIEVIAESQDHSVQYDVGYLEIQDLRPGQTKTDTVEFYPTVPTDALFRFSQIQRTSSG